MQQYLSPGVYVKEVPSAVKAIAGVGTSTAGFVGVMPNNTINLVARDRTKEPTATDPAPKKFVTFEVKAELNKPKLITNWTRFTKLFGDLVGDEEAAAGTGTSVDEGQLALARAVYGFFNNGGGSCYVVRVADSGDYKKGLDAFATIDDISLVAIPGATDLAAHSAIIDHCTTVGDRFGILDGPDDVNDLSSLTVVASPPPASTEAADRPRGQSTGQPATGGGRETGGSPDAQPGTAQVARSGFAPPNSSFAAWYFPWITVFDPADKLLRPTAVDSGIVKVAPSGYIAGVYARVDGDRGVFKAPANEIIRGALGVTRPLSRADQDNLNPSGVNCIRALNGNIYVWGARTVGGNANADLKYINIRRTLLFLLESIDEGTQWVVFEPNTPALWQKITRNVTAFLTEVWRSGALFGTTPAEAFYVRCDAELNPPDQRELGTVVTEIGVAIVRPAEFVVFRVSQFSPSGPQQ